jgi:hypothetical protein
MKRFALGLGIGLTVGVVGVALVLAVFWRAPVSAAGAVAAPALLFENNRVKAWSLTLEPGQATSQHPHQLDEIVICLESSKL